MEPAWCCRHVMPCLTLNVILIREKIKDFLLRSATKKRAYLSELLKSLVLEILANLIIKKIEFTSILEGKSRLLLLVNYLCVYL